MCSSGGIIYTSRYFCTGGNEMKRTRLTCQFPTGQLWRGVDTRCVNTSHKHGRIRFSSNVFTVLSWVALVLGMTWLHQIVLSKQTRQLGYGQRNGWVRLKSVNVYNTHTICQPRIFAFSCPCQPLAADVSNHSHLPGFAEEYARDPINTGRMERIWYH